MKHSLRLRLLAGMLVWMLLTIAAAGWGLRALLQGHVEQQLAVQLVMDLDHLSGSIDWAPDGRLDVENQPDARLAQPLSGLYWQIDRLGAQPQVALARSRSLWDQTLCLPAAPSAYPAQGHSLLRMADARGRALLVVARTVQLPDEGAPPLRLAVAADEALIAEPMARFTRLLLIALGALALALALAVVLQLQLALRPLRLLRERLAAVRAGQAARLEGRFAQELEPLVAEFNHVLAENADMVQRARTQAGNLAHAVHTPLTILANAADGQAIEAHHLAAPATHVGLCAVGFLVDERIALQELVECRLPTSKCLHRILSQELADGFIGCTQSRTPGSPSSFFRRGLACTGRSSAC